MAKTIVPKTMRNMGNLLAKLGWTPEGHRRQSLPVLGIAEALASVAAHDGGPATAGQTVRIRGRVVANEGGIVAPFSGRRVVAVRARYLKHSPVPAQGALGVTKQTLGEWNLELDERHISAFWIADGSGHALVQAEGADISAPEEEVAISPAMRETVNRYLDEHGVIRAMLHGGGRMTETCVSPGDQVEIIGPARRESIEHPRAAGYRELALPSLVVFAAEGPKGALTVQRLG